MYTVFVILITSSWIYGVHGATSSERERTNLPTLDYQPHENSWLRPLIVKVDDEGNFQDFSVNFSEVVNDEGIVQFSTNFKHFCRNEVNVLTEVAAEEICDNEVEPIIILSESKQRCGTRIVEGELVGQLYDFAYVLPGYKHRREIIYKFCFDTKAVNVNYTWHKIRSPTLLGKSDALGKLADYHSYIKTTSGYYISEEKFELMAEKYEALYKEGMSSDFVIPSEDMIFSSWQKALYHMVNVKSSNPTVTDTWKHINEKIRQKAIKMNIEFEIFTMVNERSAKEKYEVIWRKVVYDQQSKAGVAVIVHHGTEIPVNESTENPSSNRSSHMNRMASTASNFSEQARCGPHYQPEEPSFTSRKSVVTFCPISEHDRQLFNQRFEVENYLNLEDDTEETDKNIAEMNDAVLQLIPTS